MKKLNAAFIDDDADFEIPLFEEAFSGYFNITSASNYDDFIKIIESKKEHVIDLFVLDLYFPDPQKLTDTDSMKKFKGEPIRLKPDGANIRKAYNNNKLAEKRYTDMLSAYNQSIQGGLDLMYKIRERFGDVPVIFYSRKATIKDALYCLRAGAMEVIKKPTGSSDAETKKITLKLKDTLKEKMLKAMAKEKHDLTDHVDLILSSLDFFS
jgi:DNA-binding NtrC family response regulator